MAKIHTVADVPPDLVEAWVQHLRDFDAAHPGCHFQIAAQVPDHVTVEDMIAMLDNLDPPVPVTNIIRGRRVRRRPQ